MATPRIFVSSTCYDLQEIRFQLRSFIQEYGYEAVLSEFDDIFYDYDKHVQDSCLDEIPKCQLFILIIGNNYGSFYHKESSRNKVPDSVTLQEFRKALNHKINKHLFINKFVDYDYNNYKRALNSYISEFFRKNDIDESEVENQSLQLRNDFNKKYYFPSESYKYIFPFLDVVYELNEGNARNTFESFADIKSSLKKQWAGLIYEALTSKRNATVAQVNNLEVKLDHIETSLNKLIGSRTSSEDGNITLNVNDLIMDIKIDNLEKFQDKLHNIIDSICNYEVYSDFDGSSWSHQRFYFNKKPDINFTKNWLKGLNKLVKNFKWSKFITLDTLFPENQIQIRDSHHNDIPYTVILELSNLYNSLNEDEKESFTNTIAALLRKNYDKNTGLSSSPPTTIQDDNNLPF